MASIWKILGLKPTSDDRAIRKAYAVKLKITRPDEDPAGFQKLLEARDQALDIAAHMRVRGKYQAAETADDRDEESQTEEPVLEGVVVRPVRMAGLPDPEPIEQPAPIAWENETGPDEALDEPIDGNDAELEFDPYLKMDVALEALGPDMWHGALGPRWAKVFDQIEEAPFGITDGLKQSALLKLVDNIRARIVADTFNRPSELDREYLPALQPYIGVLKDLEARFQFLKADTLLLEYMSRDDALFLLSALTLTVGRAPVAREQRVRDTGDVPWIDPHILNAVYANESRMIDYYNRSAEASRFKLSFSFLGLLLPVLVGVYYRLYGLALLAAVPLYGMLILSLARDRLPPVFAVLVHQALYWIYLVTAIAFALQWRRLRIQRLARMNEHFSKLHEQFEDRLAALIKWAKGDRDMQMVLLVLGISVGAVRLLAQFRP